MDFPSYVPHAVRVSMANRLDGPEGWLQVLAKADAEVQKFEFLQSRYVNDPNALDGIRLQRIDAVQHRDHLAAEVACLQRLVGDERMQPAYAKLAGALTTDEQLSGFIYAAWAARMDYGKHRDRAKAAEELARDVVAASGVLADVLRKAESFVGPFLPSEFFSIESLLEKTEHDREHRDFHMWPSMRRAILGTPHPRSTALGDPPPAAANYTPPQFEIRLVPVDKGHEVDPAEEQRNMLRYAWATAPSMARIIATMQREALAYVPTESGAIGAALASRKRNAKTEYLRAFGALLRGHGIDRTPGIVNAMAVTATVVLNEADDAVTAADVRSALARPAG